MSEQTIWNSLRNYGLSEAGAAGVMGNMYCESLLQSNNVENRCPMSDDEYTASVDNGSMSQSQFMHDAYGYGLCQWTYYTRKQELYTLAKGKGKSISDEQLQCELCITELKRDYSGLYNFLCTTTDIYTSAYRVCAEYERPAVNNIAPRASKAQEIYSKYAGTSVSAVEVPSVAEVKTADNNTSERCNVSVRVLKRGDLGRDVFMLQCGLNDAGFSCGIPDGDFGSMTVYAVNQLKVSLNLPQNGVADEAVWEFLFK